jgi:hypothetical protein
VRCQLDDLERLPTDSDRLEAPGRLPVSLPDTYVRILERIDREYPVQTTTLVKRTLKWLALKEEGVFFTLSGLCQAISLSSQMSARFPFRKVPHADNVIE